MEVPQALTTCLTWLLLVILQSIANGPHKLASNSHLIASLVFEVHPTVKEDCDALAWLALLVVIVGVVCNPPLCRQFICAGHLCTLSSCIMQQAAGQRQPAPNKLQPAPNHAGSHRSHHKTTVKVAWTDAACSADVCWVSLALSC